MMKYSTLSLFLISFLSCITFGQELNPGDGVRITLYNIEDSVQDNFFIQEDGNIHLPYLGFISTNEKEFSILKKEIIDGYNKIYRNPEINVLPLLRVNVLGEVGNPGTYYLTGFEKLTDLLALAGGETNDSDIDDIRLVRNNLSLEIDLEAFLEGRESFNDIGIESGDQLYVPRTWWVNARDASIIVSGVAVLVAIAGLFTN